MKAVIREPKTAPTSFQTRHSGSSKVLASPLEAVNLIGAEPTTVTKRPIGHSLLSLFQQLLSLHLIGCNLIKLCKLLKSAIVVV